MNARGSVTVPGDKSISHRALIVAAIGDGIARVRDILESADVESTAGALRAMGGNVPALTPRMEIAGVGLRGLHAPADDIDCGNSGTTTRLLAGLISGSGITARLTGDASLSSRPMQRVSDPLTQMGATFSFENGDGLPVVISGSALTPIHWRSKVASAQVKSAIMLAGLTAGVEVTVEEPVRSRDHTERMLASLTGEVRQGASSVTLGVVRSLAPLDIDIPGDPSSAAFLVAAAVLGVSQSVTLPGVCVNPARIGFLRALERMGCSIERTDERTACGEPVATLRATPSRITNVCIDGAEVASMIDELPLLACVAAAAGVRAVIRGAEELRFKETDRISATASNLRALGAEVVEFHDGLEISAGAEIADGDVRTFGDHRIAMAFGVLAAATGMQITVDDRECVRISYPDFWTDMESLLQ